MIVIHRTIPGGSFQVLNDGREYQFASFKTLVEHLEDEYNEELRVGDKEWSLITALSEGLKDLLDENKEDTITQKADKLKNLKKALKELMENY